MRKAPPRASRCACWSYASMGPQLDSCGKARPRTKTPSLGAWLQWGRNLTVAERLFHCNALPARHAASMGPQLDSCGKIGSPITGVDCHLASMGPQLDSCGKTYALNQKPVRFELQWGRNLTVAESGDGRVGRDDHHVASMGPQLDSCGKDTLKAMPANNRMLQWGRNLTVAESASSRARRARSRSFNGAAT